MLHFPIHLLHFPIKFASFPQKNASFPQQFAAFPQQNASFPQQFAAFPYAMLCHVAKKYFTKYSQFFLYFFYIFGIKFCLKFSGDSGIKRGGGGVGVKSTINFFTQKKNFFILRCAFSYASSDHETLFRSSCIACRQKVSRRCVKACDTSYYCSDCKNSCTVYKQRAFLQCE